MLASTMPKIMAENVLAIALLVIGIASLVVALLPLAPALLSLLLSLVDSLAKPFAKSLAPLLEKNKANQANDYGKQILHHYGIRSCSRLA